MELRIHSSFEKKIFGRVFRFGNGLRGMDFLGPPDFVWANSDAYRVPFRARCLTHMNGNKPTHGGGLGESGTTTQLSFVRTDETACLVSHFPDIRKYKYRMEVKGVDILYIKLRYTVILIRFTYM